MTQFTTTKRDHSTQKTTDTTTPSQPSLSHPAQHGDATQCRFTKGVNNTLLSHAYGKNTAIQRKESADQSQADAKQHTNVVKQPNRTGLPDRLKNGLEHLSGIDLSQVRVHYNSTKPVQLGALAYTQGQDIHIGRGHEKHLPHEGWHVVQQMQGRVRPTLQMKGEGVNDNGGLEREADVMGDKAKQTIQAGCNSSQNLTISNGHNYGKTLQLKLTKKLKKKELNVVGELHPESELIRDKEKDFMKSEIGDDANYWTEHEFSPESAPDNLKWKGDPQSLQFQSSCGRYRGRIEWIYKWFSGEVASNRNREVIPDEDRHYFKDARNCEKEYNNDREIFLENHEEFDNENEFYKRLKMEIEYAKQVRTGPAMNPGMSNMYNNLLTDFVSQDFLGAAGKLIQSLRNIEVLVVELRRSKKLFTTNKPTFDRSFAMNKYANAYFKAKGIWKVGEAHVHDIITKSPMREIPMKYNLIHREDFQRAIDKKYKREEQRDKVEAEYKSYGVTDTKRYDVRTGRALPTGHASDNITFARKKLFK